MHACEDCCRSTNNEQYLFTLRLEKGLAKLSNFFEELKARKVRKTLGIYLASALTTLTIVRYFAEAYELPKSVLTIALTILTCGIASAFLFAWYHGKEGSQKFSRKEIGLHSIIALIAIVTSVRFALGPPQPQFPERFGKSVAVLPFRNASEDKDDIYFADGIMEDILTHLSRISDLRVISRTSSMKYRDSNKSAREIAAELGVSSILEGSVRRSGSMVRIDGRLINAALDQQIWGEQYDREMSDIFAVQSDVAKRIAEALKAQLSPEEQQRIEKRATVNTDAYGFFLQGRDHYNRLTKENNEKAIEYFRRAIALDSTYAQAYAGLADAYAQRFQRYGFEEFWIDSSIALAEHALKLDPTIAEPYKSLGLAYYHKEWYRKSMEQNRKALELNPNFATVYSNMGELLDWTGRHDEALRLVKKSISLQPGRVSDQLKLGSIYFSLGLDSLAAHHLTLARNLQPSYTTIYSALSEHYLMQGETDRARALLDSVLSANPDDPSIIVSLGYLESATGNYKKSASYYDRMYAMSPDHFGLLVPYGYALIRSGQTARGEKILDESVRKNLASIKAGSEEAHRRYDLARVAAFRNDKHQALQWLSDAVGRGTTNYRGMLQEPMFERLRNDPEFVRLVESTKGRIRRMQTQVLAKEKPGS